MSKINILIVDSDRQYLKGFCNYLHTNYAKNLTITSFSDPASLTAYLKCEGPKPDIIVLDPRFLKYVSNLEGLVPMVYFDDGKYAFYSDDVEKKELPRVRKYQSGEKIIGEVLEHFYEAGNCGVLTHPSAKKCYMVCAYSAMGGSGKTTIATNLAYQLSYQGYRVFYLNLESVCSTGAYFDTSGEMNLSHLIYNLKANRKSVNNRIHTFVNTNSLYNISYFNPPDNAMEMEELSEDETGYLLSAIKTSSDFEYVIIDMSSDFSPRSLTALKACDRILFITVPDVISRKKYRIVLDSMKCYLSEGDSIFDEKLIFITNKCGIDNQSSQSEQQDFLSEGYRIPYFHQLTVETGRFLSNTFNLNFNNLIASLANDILSERL